VEFNLVFSVRLTDKKGSQKHWYTMNYSSWVFEFADVDVPDPRCTHYGELSMSSLHTLIDQQIYQKLDLLYSNLFTLNEYPEEFKGCWFLSSEGKTIFLQSEGIKHKVYEKDLDPMVWLLPELNGRGNKVKVCVSTCPTNRAYNTEYWIADCDLK